MRILVRHTLRHWPTLAGTFLLATVTQVLLLTEPQVVRLIIDRYVLKLDTLPRDVFFRGVIWLVGLANAPSTMPW